MTSANERIYMATIQRGYGDRFVEHERYIRAPDIFRAAEIFKTDVERTDLLVVAIEEVDFEESPQ